MSNTKVNESGVPSTQCNDEALIARLLSEHIASYSAAAVNTDRPANVATDIDTDGTQTNEHGDLHTPDSPAAEAVPISQGSGPLGCEGDSTATAIYIEDNEGRHLPQQDPVHSANPGEDGILSRDRYPTELTAEQVVQDHTEQLFDEILLFVLLRYQQSALREMLQSMGHNIRFDTIRQRKYAALKARYARRYGDSGRNKGRWKEICHGYSDEVTRAGHYTGRKRRVDGCSDMNGAQSTADDSPLGHENDPIEVAESIPSASTPSTVDTPGSVDPDRLIDPRLLAIPAAKPQDKNRTVFVDEEAKLAAQRLQEFLDENDLVPAEQYPPWLVGPNFCPPPER